VFLFLFQSRHLPSRLVQLGGRVGFRRGGSGELLVRSSAFLLRVFRLSARGVALGTRARQPLRRGQKRILRAEQQALPLARRERCRRILFFVRGE
jgi:hypothetical protein